MTYICLFISVTVFKVCAYSRVYSIDLVLTLTYIRLYYCANSEMEYTSMPVYFVTFVEMAKTVLYSHASNKF